MELNNIKCHRTYKIGLRICQCKQQATVLKVEILPFAITYHFLEINQKHKFTHRKIVISSNDIHLT